MKCDANIVLGNQSDVNACLRDSLFYRLMRSFQLQAVGDCVGSGVAESSVFGIVIRFAAEQPDWSRVVAQMCQETQKQSSATNGKHYCTASRESLQNLGRDGSVAIGPQRVQMKVNKVTVAV